jgi:hypothetical protein
VRCRRNLEIAHEVLHCERNFQMGSHWARSVGNVVRSSTRYVRGQMSKEAQWLNFKDDILAIKMVRTWADDENVIFLKDFEIQMWEVCIRE